MASIVPDLQRCSDKGFSYWTPDMIGELWALSSGIQGEKMAIMAKKILLNFCIWAETSQDYDKILLLSIHLRIKGLRRFLLEKNNTFD